MSWMGVECQVWLVGTSWLGEVMGTAIDPAVAVLRTAPFPVCVGCCVLPPLGLSCICVLMALSVVTEATQVHLICLFSWPYVFLHYVITLPVLHRRVSVDYVIAYYPSIALFYKSKVAKRFDPSASTEAIGTLLFNVTGKNVDVFGCLCTSM